MSARIPRFLASFALLAALTAHAGTPVLGFEIGVTTADQLQHALAGKTAVEPAGTNKFTGGPMFRTSGASYDIDSLESVTYIFDQDRRLAGVLMNMGNHRFDAIYKLLTAKYKVAAQQRPFVGDQYALFKPGDAVIELDAPHLSFEMQVRYLRNDLLSRAEAQTRAEATARKKAEAAKF